MDDNPLTPKEPQKPSESDLLSRLASMLSEGPKSSLQASNELQTPDYTALWKKALMEGRKVFELYEGGDWKDRLKKPVLTREDFSRMIFGDLLERQRKRDFDKK